MTEENISDCLGALGSFGHRLIEAECVEVQGLGCYKVAGIFGDVINALTRECIQLMHLPTYLNTCAYPKTPLPTQIPSTYLPTFLSTYLSRYPTTHHPYMPT